VKDKIAVFGISIEKARIGIQVEKTQIFIPLAS